MNRDKFEEQFKIMNCEIDPKNLDKTIEITLGRIAYNEEGYNNLIIAIEEFAECSKEITKFLRGKSDRMKLLEETADAFLSIKYIQKICNISDEELNKAINVKLERLNQTVRKEGKWQ